MSENYESGIKSVLRFISLVIRVIGLYFEAVLKIFQKPRRKKISGQNALITGSGHGLGREIALNLAQQGVNLALVDINEANNESVKQELLDLYPSMKIFTYSVDIRSEQQVEELAKFVEKDLGGIDILINNAGIVQCLPFSELSSKLVERTFQVNTLAHIWTIKQFLPGMLKRKRGHIVAIASIAGIFGTKYLTDYCASKFAVVGLMEALDMEIHDKGENENIHLTTACPASMSTGMFQSHTTRLSWILPILKANQVAAHIIDAILENRELVVIPRSALHMHRLSFILPKKVKVCVQEYLDYGVKPHAA